MGYYDVFHSVRMQTYFRPVTGSGGTSDIRKYICVRRLRLSSRRAKIQPEVNNRTKRNTEQKKTKKKIPRQVGACDQKDSLFTSSCFFFERFSCFVARAKTKLRGARVCDRSFSRLASFADSFLSASPSLVPTGSRFSVRKPALRLLLL